MKNSIRLLATLFVLISCVGCDQAAKSIARETLASRPPISYLSGLVQFQYMENPGAFLGLGASLSGAARSLLLVTFTSAVLMALVIYIYRARDLKPLQWAGLSLLAGGGIGNLVDRIFHAGRVVDFVQLSLGPVHTGVFNLADLAIVAGPLLFAAGSIGLARVRGPADPSA